MTTIAGPGKTIMAIPTRVIVPPVTATTTRFAARNFGVSPLVFKALIAEADPLAIRSATLIADLPPAVPAPEGPAAALAQTWGAGTCRDPSPDEESRGDLTNGSKRICRAKATNTEEVAIRALPCSRSGDPAAPR